MTHVFFDRDKIDWGPYLQHQQMGHGSVMEVRGKIPGEMDARVFLGLRCTNSYGMVSNVLDSIGRFLLPIASNWQKAQSKKQ